MAEIHVSLNQLLFEQVRPDVGGRVEKYPIEVLDSSLDKLLSKPWRDSLEQ